MVSFACYGYSIVVAMETRSTMTLLQAAIIFVLSCSVAGEIRCYCNDASCVRTGYMCKSPLGRCYSQLSYERDSTKSIHGCAESLPVSDTVVCDGSGSVAEAKSGERITWPILLCCKDDMCNYMDNLDINIYVTKSNGTKEMQWPVPEQHDVGEILLADRTYSEEALQRDIWFKAAVIAVPVAGGFILILLVLLAVRVLRNDNRRHHQLMQMRHHRSLAKAQLYVADHFYQNELLVNDICQNCDNVHCTRHLASSVDNTKSKQLSGVCSASALPGTVLSTNSGVYKDVHIKVDRAKNGYEKIRPISNGSTLDGCCNSVVLWGDPKKNQAAAPV